MKNLFGENSKVECLPMNIVYRDRLNTDAERSRIEKLEIFDEFEEWDLLQSHYCLCLSARGASHAKILELKI
jgi:tRNA wybutosine-synthesizing protein 4